MIKTKFWNNEDSIKFYRSEVWINLKKRFKFLLPRGSRKCACCDSKKSLQVDHIIPISVDPSKRLHINNLQLLCSVCNRGKSNKDSSRMSNLSASQRKEKANTFKGEFYAKRWFSATSNRAINKKQIRWKDGFF